ncbi:MAG: D-glycerate dehydrogenase [Alphaproteobacteria bacterium]|nr:MAG: D-glycerate dehydrogenase [Alphaproteobacteria bacterium]
MTEKKRILVTGALMPAVGERARACYNVTVLEGASESSAEAIPKAAQDHDGILCHVNVHLTGDIIRALPHSVKIIANHAVGVDNIDLDAAREKGIVVTNTPEVLSAATAEIAILLMLGAARRAGEAERLLRRGDWKSWSVDFMVGTEISGRRLGIVGMGDIGRRVAKAARGLDMEIHYHNRRRLPEDKEQGAVFHDTVEALLEVSDVLSINCPLTPATRYLLNRERIARLPPGAIVVNTARGPIVDDAALIDALRSGHVAAAGLDVFDGEPRINPGYLALENVFLLPHIGSATVRTRTAMGMRALDNLDAFFSAASPRDRVV